MRLNLVLLQVLKGYSFSDGKDARVFGSTSIGFREVQKSWHLLVEDGPTKDLLNNRLSHPKYNHRSL
ncbi:hypothetical protein N665_0181s0082 [Sinapis alba]|nr:hypothetical protein N665_0181s0082 [Sinapis alba]